MQKLRGFTLIEILIVVAVVAILAAIAIPNYSDYVTRGKISEAVAQLSTMGVKMEQYFQDNRSYAPAGVTLPCNPGTVAPLPSGSSAKYFTYACTPAPTATTFTVQATGNGNMSGFVYTIDQAGNRVTVSTGWGTCASTPCWALRKDCSC